jgi:alpha-tubulin suppressor-like RCC1 family protein
VGLGRLGQVGAGPGAGSATPVPVALPNVAGLSAGYWHTLAAKGDGTVWACGWNAFGQLGDGTTVDHARPAAVPGLTGIRSVAAGAGHSLALASGTGAVSGWGLNNVGQLGDGTTTDRPSPVTVPGLDPVDAIAAGAYLSIATFTSRRPAAWGWNALGQLGDGTNLDRHQPVAVAMPGIAKAVAAGYYHSVVVTTDDVVEGWGWDDYGQLGTGSTATIRMTPSAGARVAGASVITTGVLHTLAG